VILSFCGPLASLVCIVVVCVFLCGLFGLCVCLDAAFLNLSVRILRVDRVVSVVVFYFGYVRSAGDEVACYVSMCFGCVGRLTFDNRKIPPHELETNNFASLSNKTFIICSK